MKKALSLFLTFILCLSLWACGSSNKETENETEPREPVELPENQLGVSVETDILRITLTNAQLAIKLNASSSGTYEQIQSGTTTLDKKYFTAEEYDPVKDVGLAYVAPKGHTYVAFEYLATNLDRASVEFDGTFNEQFITVEYGDHTYNQDTVYGCESENGYTWKKYNSGNILLLAGEEYYYRGYVDIPVDAEDLNDDFALIFSLPNSKGETEQFKYAVKAEDRAAIQSQEISVEEAAASFTEEEGKEYFMEEYSVLSGDEIKAVVSGEFWEMQIINPTGYWHGGFDFESNGKIKEYIPSIGYGYYNKRTWRVKNDTLILDGEDVCQMRKVTDSIYLLVVDGSPFALLT